MVSFEQSDSETYVVFALLLWRKELESQGNQKGAVRTTSLKLLLLVVREMVFKMCFRQDHLTFYPNSTTRNLMQFICIEFKLLSHKINFLTILFVKVLHQS